MKTAGCARSSWVSMSWCVASTPQCRDRDWGTVPAILSDVEIESNPDSFRISFSAEHRAGEVHFTWQGLISGSVGAAGVHTVSFSMQGQALSSFLKNRIGLCVLLPISLAGAACSIEHVTGIGNSVGTNSLAFPLDVDHRQPPPSFSDLAGLHFQAGEAQVELGFSGDDFELEDQRNWTDASFKIYSTPLRLPYPVEIQGRNPVNQSVSLRFQPAPATDRRPRPAAPNPPDPLYFPSGETPASPPRLGLGCASHDQPLSETEIERLRRLRLDHLRARPLPGGCWLS